MVQYLTFARVGLVPPSIFSPHAAVRLGSNSAALSLVFLCSTLTVYVPNTKIVNSRSD